MRRLVEEVEGEGMESLMGKVITCFCMNYFYTGILVGVSNTCILLKNPKIIYETGAFTDKDWSDAQELPNDIYVNTASIEAFGIVK